MTESLENSAGKPNVLKTLRERTSEDGAKPREPGKTEPNQENQGRRSQTKLTESGNSFSRTGLRHVKYICVRARACSSCLQTAVSSGETTTKHRIRTTRPPRTVSSCSLLDWLARNIFPRRSFVKVVFTTSSVEGSKSWQRQEMRKLAPYGSWQRFALL